MVRNLFAKLPTLQPGSGSSLSVVNEWARDWRLSRQKKL